MGGGTVLDPNRVGVTAAHLGGTFHCLFRPPRSADNRLIEWPVSDVGKPYFLTKFPPTVSIVEGESVKLYAKASDDVTQLTWTRDGAVVSDGGSYK